MATKQNAQELAQLIEAKQNEFQGFADMATRAKESGNEAEAAEAQALADTANKELQALQAKAAPKARKANATKAAPKAATENPAETPQDAPKAAAGGAGQKPPKGKGTKAAQAPKENPPANYVGAPKFKRDPRNTQLSGARLLAHTVAYIAIRTGFVPGVAMPEWVALVGPSALAYHKAKGNLAIGPTGAPVLTDKGAQHFQTRKGNEAALIDTYKKMMLTGEFPEGMMGEQNPPIKIA